MFKFKNKIRYKHCEACSTYFCYYGKNISTKVPFIYTPEEFMYKVSCNYCGLEYFVVANKEDKEKFEKGRLKAFFKI